MKEELNVVSMAEVLAEFKRRPFGKIVDSGECNLKVQHCGTKEIRTMIGWILISDNTGLYRFGIFESGQRVDGETLSQFWNKVDED